MSSWTLTQGSDKRDEALDFITFSCQPEIQALRSRMIGAAPVVDPALTGLRLEELAAVTREPVADISYQVYLDDEAFITDAWDRMVAKP